MIDDLVEGLVVAEPVDLDRLDPARRVLAAFLVRHRGRTRTEYLRALRAWAAWCQAHQLPLLAVTRPHVEFWQRQLEEQGLSAIATRWGTTRRLSVHFGFRSSPPPRSLISSPSARRSALVSIFSPRAVSRSTSPSTISAARTAHRAVRRVSRIGRGEPRKSDGYMLATLARQAASSFSEVSAKTSGGSPIVRTVAAGRDSR